MAQLHLKIVTPENEIYDNDVDMVTVSTQDGQIGILPEHISLMSQLAPGELIIKQGNKENAMVVGGGLLQVADNIVTIATDLAETVEEIDEKVAEEARERAKAALEQTLTDEEYAETMATLERSLAKLNVKRRHHSH